jgi:hypothetical protein
MHSDPYSLTSKRKGKVYKTTPGVLKDVDRDFGISSRRTSHIGEICTQTMENYDENDIDKSNKMIAKASEGLYTFLYLENLDQDKYGSII